jgi:hypothetical protein
MKPGLLTDHVHSRDAVVIQPRVTHVAQVFLARDRTCPERAAFDRC